MAAIKSYLKVFARDLKHSFFDLAMIIGAIAFFQFGVLQEVPNGWESMVIGLGIVGVGLALFMRGLEMGIFPLGEALAQKLATSRTRAWVLLFALIIGFSTTIAEPALIAIADKAALISGGVIDANMLRMVVALSVGSALVLGVLRIFFKHSLHWYIIAGYMAVLALTPFAPPEIVALAFDSGGVTTGVVTVPLIAALGIGLSSALNKKGAAIDGFGLVALASLTPMIFVQLYGIMAYSSGGTTLPFTFPDFTFAENLAAGLLASAGLAEYGARFVTTLGSVLPVILSVVLFYYLILKQPIPHFGKRMFGFFLVVIGLYAFVIGLEAGLFPIGESLAHALAENGDVYLLYTFAFVAGFATTIAEPALTAIARKAQEISAGALNAFVLRLFVACGVGLGILLGVHRIIQGDAIVFYIMAGYIVVVLLTIFAPRAIIPIAYDSGGVTTSEITVPIIAALGLGLATVIPGRDPLIDGFGLIAFASLFPMVTVLTYGIISNRKK